MNVGPTIVRSVLLVPQDMGARHDRNPPGDFGSCPKLVLLDVSGRKALDLHTGANDIGHLSPGVYFVRSSPGVARGASSARRTSKVIVTR
jgi:hypothetical protein